MCIFVLKIKRKKEITVKKWIIRISAISAIVVICSLFFFFRQNKKNKQEKQQDQIYQGETCSITRNTQTEAKFIYGKNTKLTNIQEIKKEYETMPSNIKGHQVIGRLDIPAIQLSTYILGETNKETLNISVTKLAGPQINEIGNFCITGHNYLNSKMFFKLKQVKKDDEVILTNTYEESVNYKVYEIKEVLPEEVEVLSQDTKEEREVTLITCTFGAVKRIVVKASEVYD